MSKRIELVRQQLRTAYVLAREARLARNELRDNYQALLDAANDELNEYQTERDELLVKLNVLLVAAGQPEITLDEFKDLP
jgi:uncharacterized membrane protein YccC